MRRNVASQVVGAQMITAADGSAFTGSVTVSVTGDGGTQATGSVGSGACTHEGNGFHTYAPAQAETNYAHVAFTFTGTGAIPATVQVYPMDYNSSGQPTVGALAANSVTASALATDAVNEIQSGLATQTSVDDLPTNSDLATALAAADDAVLTAIDALPTATENADVLLNRDMSAVSDTNARSPLNALRHIRNKWGVSGGTLTVTKEDDSTIAWTSAVSTDPSAEPVIGSDPA